MTPSVPASAGGVQVVTLEDSQQVNVMQTFSRANPLALGVVQIMIGMMVILFGIPMAMGGFPLLVVYSGTFVWGALLYIITGSITVAAWKSSSIRLVKTALSLNISSAITSFITAVLLSVDASRTWGLVEGFFRVLVVFHFLQLAVSLTVIVFASLATCECTCKEQLSTVFVTPGSTSMAAQAPPPSYPPPAPPAKPITLDAELNQQREEEV